MKLTKAKEIASKQKDKSQWDALEYLEQSSNPSTKEAAKYLKDRNDKRQMAQYEQDLAAISAMENNKKKEEYCYFLSATANELLSQIGFGNGWEKTVVATKDDDAVKIYGKGYKTQLGVLVIVKDPMGRVYVQATTPTGEGNRDLEMIGRFIRAAEATVGKYNDTLGTMNSDFLPLRLGVMN